MWDTNFNCSGGVIVIYTPDVPYPWQLPPEARGELGGGTTEEEFKETIKEAQIGVKYFKDRKKIAREYKERLEKLTASKEPKTFREPKKKRNKNLKFYNIKKCQLLIPLNREFLTFKK